VGLSGAGKIGWVLDDLAVVSLGAVEPARGGAAIVACGFPERRRGTPQAGLAALGLKLEKLDRFAPLATGLPGACRPGARRH
jgi:hypothetical protein